MSLLGFLFSFEGRINRLHYWVSALIMGVLVWCFFLFGIVTAGNLGIGAVDVDTLTSEQKVEMMLPLAGVGLAAFLVLVWCSLAITSKRLHDLGQSAALLIPIYGVPFLLNALGGMFIVLAILINVAMMIWLGFFPGNAGDNRYGPSPNGTGFGSSPRGAAGGGRDTSDAVSDAAWMAKAEEAMRGAVPSLDGQRFAVAHAGGMGGGRAPEGRYSKPIDARAGAARRGVGSAAGSHPSGGGRGQTGFGRRS
ncbi:MAG: DUF805 domain-containing protein [Rhizobiales bacterium]|nr:DUF805 domain-containing protein [Hyphomicrobiales bacterium]